MIGTSFFYCGGTGRAVLCVKGSDRDDDYAVESRIFVDVDVLLLSPENRFVPDNMIFTDFCLYFTM